MCEPLTGTRTSTLLKARLHTRERTWATGMPTTALGRDRSTHERKLRSPMPGSMITGTAPILKSAKAEAMSGRPGFTITSARSPLATPFFLSLAHQASVSASSSAKVRVR